MLQLIHNLDSLNLFSSILYFFFPFLADIHEFQKEAHVLKIDSLYHAVADPGFPRRGGANPRGGRQHTI